jgi:hypothetical protein
MDHLHFQTQPRQSALLGSRAGLRTGKVTGRGRQLSTGRRQSLRTEPISGTRPAASVARGARSSDREPGVTKPAAFVGATEVFGPRERRREADGTTGSSAGLRTGAVESGSRGSTKGSRTDLRVRPAPTRSRRAQPAQQTFGTVSDGERLTWRGHRCEAFGSCGDDRAEPGTAPRSQSLRARAWAREAPGFGAEVFGPKRGSCRLGASAATQLEASAESERAAASEEVRGFWSPSGLRSLETSSSRGSGALRSFEAAGVRSLPEQVGLRTGAHRGSMKRRPGSRSSGRHPDQPAPSGAGDGEDTG